MASFLERSRPGNCGKTREAVAESSAACKRHELGAALLPGRVYMSWRSLAAACVDFCQRCERCRFISISPTYRDCSWYARCEVDNLAQSPHGFRSYAMTAQTTKMK